MKEILYISIFILCLWSGCKTPDTISQASMKTPVGTHSTLPPSTEEHFVLGRLAGIHNFVVRYSPEFYRGGMPERKSALSALKKLGISTIVTITPDEQERQWAKQKGIQLIELPFDQKTPLTQSQVELFLSVLDQGHGKVYVHCHGGTHRAALLGILYRVYQSGWPSRKAVEEYLELGGSTDSNMVKMLSNFIQL